MFCERSLNAGRIEIFSCSFLPLMRNLPVVTKKYMIESSENVDKKIADHKDDQGSKWIGNTPVDKNDEKLIKPTGPGRPILDFLYPELVVGS